MQTQKQIDKIIATRPENISIVRKLRIIEKLDNKDIAQRMGVSEDVVRLILARNQR